MGLIQGFEAHGQSKRLYVLLHSFTNTPAKMTDLHKVIARQDGDGDFYIPTLPFGLWSLRKPVAIVEKLRADLDALWETRQGQGAEYDSVVLVGHSFGALIARKLYVHACGETAMVPFEPELSDRAARPWARKVDRLILLAAMNRGWSISHHMGVGRLLAWTAGVGLGTLYSWIVRRRPLIFAIRRGAPFLTHLRIQWIAMRQAANDPQRDCGDATVIQLLGTVDDMVSPEDNVDLATGRDFVYLDVPFSNHSNVVQLDATGDGEKRRAVFEKALTSPARDLALEQFQIRDILPPEPRHDITDVVFVIHGIRDVGYWTHRIARRVLYWARQENAAQPHRPPRIFTTETSSYGYFPMLPFVLPWTRREKVEWLMDRYAENFARYPDAKFSYVGHSNGTYLLAKALEEYAACRFQNVVFAGSVVRNRYPWHEIAARGQVRAVLNYVATHDWVVALFQKALGWIRAFDLGGAGHDGFVLDDKTAPNQVTQIRYIKGAHSAALTEQNWDEIARFVVTGTPAPAPVALTVSRRHPVLQALALLPVVPLAMLLNLWLLGTWLHATYSLPEVAGSLVIAAYLWVIYKVLTKV